MFDIIYRSIKLLIRPFTIKAELTQLRNSVKQLRELNKAERQYSITLMTILKNRNDEILKLKTKCHLLTDKIESLSFENKLIESNLKRLIR